VAPRADQQADLTPVGLELGGAVDERAAIADLARQGRDITRRHPWLPDAVRRPAVIGPNGLRYLDCFLGLLAGSGLDTPTKLQFMAMINGFAIMYGGMEATLASQQASTGVSPDQHQAAQVASIVSAAATGQYPNLAAALTAAEPSRIRDADEVFDSCVYHLIDGALSGQALTRLGSAPADADG
jgi:tetracycline repressor-like protein